ncbi:MAG: hypothetical protein HYV96_11020 [Opitutae bacterium]|nr:hypothetical protein [Opitutae bacterium]
MNPSATLPPYEIHAHGGGFTTFEAGDAVALPLIQLNKATLRGASGQRMLLEYSAAEVVIEGDGLAELFAHLLGGRVKAIRRGNHDGCTVAAVQVLEV